jgi:hypothetical protein
VHEPEGTTWADTVETTLADLPVSMVFFLVLVGVGVTTGAVVGAVSRHLVHLSRGHARRSEQLARPRV